MKVEVVDYNPEWHAEFVEEAQKISEILTDRLVDLQHIGSTAVVGMAAKPVIDIMPVVIDIEEVDQFNQQFEMLGYECMGEFGIPGRRYFRKGKGERTHQIHIFERENVEDITRHLALRDYLKTHPRDAKKYGELKKRLAQRYANDIDGYCAAKDSFIKKLEGNALKWYQ